MRVSKPVKATARRLRREMTPPEVLRHPDEAADSVVCTAAARSLAPSVTARIRAVPPPPLRRGGD